MSQLHPDKESFSLEEARQHQRSLDVDAVVERIKSSEQDSDSDYLFESIAAAEEYRSIIDQSDN